MAETTKDHLTPDDENRVGEILQAWIGRRDLGNAEPAETLIAQHPKFASRLRDCIDSIEMLDDSGFIEQSATVAYPKIPDFEILGELGRGGMGIVYEARQISLDRLVALKILPITSVDPLAAQRFQREAETAAALHHTNIVPIHAVGQNEGVHWYAMQRIEGKPLSSLLQQNPNGVDTDEVARIGIESAEALALAHHHGVVHRDIKPGNLLITEEGHVWLTDFGLARRDADSGATVTGAMIGTPRYMSPEQVFAPRGAVLDHRSDIYSLGATMYELATGRVLFDGDTPMDVLQQIRTSEPAKPRTIRSGIPRDLEVVLQKCLAKDPKERYQSATDLASDLRAVREARPIQARGVPPWVSLYRRLKRHRGRLKTATNAIAGTLAAIAIAFLMISSSEQSSLGSLHIESENGPYIASIYRVDENGVGTTPLLTTTVPMQDPIPLDAGEYEVSLSSHAQHSRTVLMDVAVGEATRAKYIDRRKATTGISLEKGTLEIIRDLDGTELLGTLTDSEFAVYGSEERKLFQVDLDTILPKVEFRYDMKNQYGGNRLSTSPFYARTRRICASTVDFDGDGSGEIVLTAESEPVIAALRSDGTTLWTAKIDLPSIPNPPAKRGVETVPSVVEVVPTNDLDDDGAPELVVTLIRTLDRTQLESFIATISGKTGKTLAIATLPVEKPSIIRPMKAWPREGTLRYEFSANRAAREITHLHTYNGNFYRGGSSSSHPIKISGGQHFAFTLPTPPPLHIVSFENKMVGVRVTSSSLDAWDLRTGLQVGSTIELPFTLAARPVRIRIDKSDKPAFLLWSETNRKNPSTKLLGALVLGEANLRWQREVQFHWDVKARQLERCDFPLIEDLDGDAIDEILVPERSASTPNSQGRLSSYDAATGNPNWDISPTIDSIENTADRAAVLGDFDGDGVRDIATVTLSGKQQTRVNTAPTTKGDFNVYADLFSGADGSKLGSWHTAVESPHQVRFVLAIDRLISDGQSKLEASFVSGDFEDAQYHTAVVLFDLASQQPPTVTRGVSRLGRIDSPLEQGFYLQRPGVNAYHEYRAVWRERDGSDSSTRADSNRLIASWVGPDGSGRILLQTKLDGRIRAIDIETGRTLWSRLTAGGDVQATPVLDEQDRSTAESIFLQAFSRGETKPELIDGESGRLRWTLPMKLGFIEEALSVKGENGDFVQVYGHASFVGNGSSNVRSMLLIQANARDGEFDWHQDTFNAMYPPQIGKRPAIRTLRVDCNNDGIKDCIIPDDADPGDLAIAAYSGVDGKRLWSFPINLPSDHWLSELPWPMMIACGDKGHPRIVVFDSTGSGGFMLKMLAANGSQVAQEILPTPNGPWRADRSIGRAPGLFEMTKIDLQEDWPRLAITFPTGDDFGAEIGWLKIGTKQEGFEAVRGGFTNGEPGRRIWSDVDGSGIANECKLVSGKLVCLDDEGTKELWARRGYQQIVCLADSAGKTPMALVNDVDGKDALIDLRQGRERWNRGLRIKEEVNLVSVRPVTPRVQATGKSSSLISVTRENVMWTRLAPDQDSAVEEFAIQDFATHSQIDPRRLRRLPTSPLANGQSFSMVVGELLWTLLTSFFAVCLPALYLYRLIRRQHNLSYLMMAPVVAAAAIVAWRYVLEPSNSVVNPPSDSPILTLLRGTMMVVAAAVMIQVFAGGHTLIGGLIGASTLALMGALIGLPILIDRISNGSGTYQWGLPDVVMIGIICVICVMILGSPLWAILMYQARKKRPAKSWSAS
ncbi:MAG: protein kinase [Rubripirellula sp.]